MKKLRHFVATLALLALPGLAAAQEAELIGGTVQDPANWPASPWVGNCSSTLLGEQALLTAAHCVSDGGTKTFTMGTTRYSGKCTHHPQYSFAEWYAYSSLLTSGGEYMLGTEVPVGATQDWALCHITTPVPDIKFEEVADVTDFQCQVGMEVTWTGYGCQRWGGSIDGKFRAGKVKVTRCPSGNDADIVTRGSVALCSGDSGGGGFVVKEDGKRYVIGVNSRSNTTDTSYVSGLVAPTSFKAWALGWLTAKNAKACGLSPLYTERCRNGDDVPPPPPPPGDCDAELAAAIAAQNAATKAQADSSSALGALQQCMSR